MKKEYRVEINSLFIKDVEASSPEEAKKKAAAEKKKATDNDTKIK